MFFVKINILSTFILLTLAYNIEDSYIDENIINDNTNVKILYTKYKEKVHHPTPPTTKKTIQTTTSITYKVTQNMFMRKIRNLASKPLRLECLFCYGNGTSKSDDNCYQSVVSTTEKCKLDEQCYIEYNPKPNYIKRGCVSKNKLNRTFHCNCPLCNDKPADDLTYYEYENMRDWKFDNFRLGNLPIGEELLCKTCETKDTHLAAAKICRLGKFANYMICDKNQICYTKIEGETRVSRGCTNLPAVNTFYTYCNTTLCNTKSFEGERVLMSVRSTSFNMLKSIGSKIKEAYVFLSWILLTYIVN